MTKPKITSDCDDMNNTEDNIDDIPSFSVELTSGDNSDDWNDNVEDNSCTYEKIILKEY